MTELVKGDLVRHWEHGVGQVQTEGSEGIVVSFREGVQQTVEREDIVLLARDGFWSLIYADHDAAVRELNEHPAKAIALLLRDFPNNEARTEEIREQLEEFVTTDWRSWWRQTQRLLKQEPLIDTSRSREGIYALAEKPQSHIEELYAEFRALPRLKSEDDGSTILNPSKIAVARSILVGISHGGRLTPDKQNDVQDFVVEAATSDTVSVANRANLVLRLLELRWVSDDQASSVLRSLCRNPIRFYELDRYAQNRVINAVFKYAGLEEGHQSFLTAFATGPALMRHVCDLYLAHGQAERLRQGLWIGLSENLVDAETEKSEMRRWYHALAQRLRGLGSVLETLVFDANVLVEWEELARRLAWLVSHLNKLDSAEPVLEETLQSFVGLWRRAMAFAPHSKRTLYLNIPLTEGLRTRIVKPILAYIFSADPALELADAFVERMHESDKRVLSPLLECIVDDHWRWSSEAEAFRFLIAAFNSRKDVLHWITERTIEAVQSKPGVLLLHLPVLDQLASRDLEATWQEKVNGLRQAAFRHICEAVRRGEELELPAFTFDAMSLGGLQDFLAELEREMTMAVEQAQAHTAQAREEAQLAEERLSRSEAALEELRRGYRQPDREARLAERMLILRAFSAMAAEFERFVTHQETGRRELTGVMRRLNSLLGSFGVVPFGEIGDEVVFEPSEHEFVGASEGTVERVTIVEHGYKIFDLEGKERLLKPAKVMLLGGD